MTGATAKDTDAALRRHVLPLLKAEGFEDGTGRKRWRRRDGRIDHVEVTSFSAYMAASMRVPTASVAVRLGVSLPQYGVSVDPFVKDHLKSGPKGLRPAEAQFPIRGVLSPTGAPPMTQGRWGWVYTWIWEIGTTEAAEAAALDIRAQFEGYGLDWLSRDWAPELILERLSSDEPEPRLDVRENGANLWLNAALPGSQVRAAHLAMVRRALARRG